VLKSRNGLSREGTDGGNPNAIANGARTSQRF